MGNNKQKETYRQMLSHLDLGLENRFSLKSVCFRRSKTSCNLLMATKKPKLLLLDEHTAALDQKQQRGY